MRQKAELIILMVRLNSELVSKLDAWIEAQPEPKPSRSEAIRRLLDPVKLFFLVLGSRGFCS